MSTLAENIVTKIDEVTELGLSVALTHLAYMQDLNKQQEMEMKKNR